MRKESIIAAKIGAERPRGNRVSETRALLGAVAKRLQAIEEKQGFVEELLSERGGAGRLHGGPHEGSAAEDS